ncbi:MAG: MgPME-cyclase complex family protein [Cyanobacterium sp.]
MTTYYYIAASEKFLTSENENLHEVLDEKHRFYKEKNKEIDFWFIKQPAFLEAPELAEVKAKCPQPSAAVVSLDKEWITFLKLRLEYVLSGEFEAPSESIPQPTASLVASS